MLTLFLKPGRDRSVRRFHPWIFSGAVARVEGQAQPGDVARVCAGDGAFIGQGFYNAHSQIVCRMLSWREEAITQVFFQNKIAAAMQLRQRCFTENGGPAVTDAYRLINAEGDGLPGLIVDRYADFLVMQIGTAGMAQRRGEIISALQNLLQPRGIFERSTGAALREEGLEPVIRAVAGEEPPEAVAIRENDLRFEAHLREGQKTGFFLDQRDHRAWVASLARGRNVLNGFAYSGGFSVYAARAGAARVVSVDSSITAMLWAKRKFAMNKLPAASEDFVAADMFQFLRATTQQFDLIVLDPPAFAHRQKDVENAARAYKDVNLYAMKILAPGGLLLTCSCSQPVAPDLFQKILFGAAADAKRFVRILGQRGHAADHPFSVYHPEGRYLQAWLLQIE